MQSYLDHIKSWSCYEIEQLKLYIDTRNKIKALKPDEVDSNRAYQLLLNSSEDMGEDELHSKRMEYLKFIFFWVNLLSSDHSSVVDLAVIRNEIECVGLTRSAS